MHRHYLFPFLPSPYAKHVQMAHKNHQIVIFVEGARVRGFLSARLDWAAQQLLWMVYLCYPVCTEHSLFVLRWPGAVRRDYDASPRFSSISCIIVKNLVSGAFQSSAPHAQLPVTGAPVQASSFGLPHHSSVLVDIKCEPSVNVSPRRHSYRRPQGNFRDYTCLAQCGYNS